MSRTTIAGLVTRIYPQNERIYFHLSTDPSPYGFSNTYLYLNQDMYSYHLLLEAAKNQWIVHAALTEMPGQGENVLVNYIYVDYHYQNQVQMNTQ